MALTPLRIALAEDEPLARARLRRLLEEAGCSVVAEFEEGGPLLEWLNSEPTLDALFLDIHMPGPSGLEVAAELPFPLRVVFVTAFRDHAPSAFDLSALDYILKPVTPERLEKTLIKLREGSVPRHTGPEFQETLQPRVVIRAGQGFVFMDLRKISHFEVIEDGVAAWSEGQRLMTQWKNLSEIEDIFPRAPLLRIQRHLLVRLACITGLRPISGNRAMAQIGRQELEVSRSATARLKEWLGIRGEFGKRN